ncbi:hypothetical protein HER21_32030, partial [Pseudomonas sp. BGM005]|nr:hypothetical protein [Pseudomonas sp. BG5]
IEWRLDGDVLRISLEVPFGTTADLDLPVTAGSDVTVDGGAEAPQVGPGRHEITVTAPAVARRRAIR